MKRRPLIAGNWKMNGTMVGAGTFAADLAQTISAKNADVAVCPPFLHLTIVRMSLTGSNLVLGAQDVAATPDGAYTGDVSAQMLLDAGCEVVIVGHSERRQYHAESNELVAKKAQAAIEAGLVPIICVGETRDQREAGQTVAVIESQINASVPANATGANTVIAYEPVWAIGTGLVASLDQIAAVHGQIRGLLENRLDEGALLRIIYGGSVKPDNASDILGLEDVDGALVGGASLKTQSFLEIINAVKV